MKYKTQWRQSPAGPSGLDYSVILPELDRMNLSSDDRDELFLCLQVIEDEALRQIHEE